MMIKTNSIRAVIRNFSIGRAIKFMFAFALLALVLGYCWNRVQRLTGASANADATGVGQHLNSGGANANLGTPSGQIAPATNSNGVSAASLNNTVRSYSGIPGHGRYQKSLVALNESSVLGEQDERVKLSNLCGIGLQTLEKFKPLWDSRRQAYVTFAPDKKAIVWNAEAPARAAAQLAESCQFFNSPPLEYDQVVSRESALRSAAYRKLNAATQTPADIQSKVGQDALQAMVREGLYDSLKVVLSKNLSFDRAYADASFMQSKLAPLYLDSTMLVLTLCRLGDDCGEGSIAANRLCAEAAICGGSAEDAILRDAYQLGYDVNLINKHINEIVAKLQAGNFEDLKPKESFNQTLQRILKSLGLG